MYTLRLTRTLLAAFDPDPEASAPPATTTRLGDWQVQPIQAGRRALLLCTSERTLLTVVLPADALDALPQRLAIGLVALLRGLAVPEPVIAAEIDQMADGVVRPTYSRTTLGAMRGLAAVVRREMAAQRRGVDVAALHRTLAGYRSRLTGGRPVGDLARDQLMRPVAASPGAAARRPRGRG